MRILNDKISLAKSRNKFFLINDFDYALGRVRNKFDNNIKFYAVGFSYGSNQLMRKII